MQKVASLTALLHDIVTEENQMTLDISSNIQDMAKLMLQVQAIIERGLINIFGLSKDQETLKQYSATKKVSRYSIYLKNKE